MPEEETSVNLDLENSKMINAAYLFAPADINLVSEPKPHRSKTVKRSAGDMYR